MAPAQRLPAHPGPRLPAADLSSAQQLDVEAVLQVICFAEAESLDNRLHC